MKQWSIIPRPREAVWHEGTVRPGAPLREQTDVGLRPEEFRLTLCPDAITLRGGGPAALLYGRAVLEQLRLQSDALPCGEVHDWPALGWRSFHIDSARHFIPLDELKKMIRMAAHFRLNRFHWHFADDQGWRIESAAFPRLHEIGSVRQGDHFDKDGNDEVQGGYYTRAEVRELVDYCRSLGIEIVPEVDMPGHVTAILAAYPSLSCTGEPIAVATKGGIFRDIFCAGKDDVFAFIERLLDDLLELFPYEYFHIGGDEAPKTRWKVCPLCRKRREAEGLSTPQALQGYFENRVIAMLAARGRKAIVWNEAANGGNLDPRATIQLWTEDREHRVAEHLARGGQVILANMMNCYCDYPYAFISLQSVHQLDTAPAELVAANPAGMLGTECLIWTERVRTAQRLEEYAWPRFAASAEVGWCGAERPDFDDFRRRLETLFPLFAQYGIAATPPEDWVPSPEEAARELAALRAMFAEMLSHEDIQDVQSEI